MKRIFLTTTLPYANSKAHIGHSFEFILADAFARWQRSRGNQVTFNLGLDEHGSKIYDAAHAAGKHVEDYLNELAYTWRDFCQDFNIEYDNFYRTSHKAHHEKVKQVWTRFVDQGYIYKKHYRGIYCAGCEAFKLPKDLVVGEKGHPVCPDHPHLDPKIVEEENYFFRLTEFKEQLLDWIKNSPAGNEFLVPREKRIELINLIHDVQDISVSRTRESTPWGVDVPGDADQVIYVWFDALLNYIFAAGYGTDDFNWDYVVQLCGPDNLRFQAVIFQALLAALNIKYTDKLLVHGTVKDQFGRKMSKSLGNTIDPVEQLQKYGADPVRYYTLANLSTYQDSSWSEQDLVNYWNANICNGYGNLVSRVTHLIDTKCDGLAGDQVDIELTTRTWGHYSKGLVAWDNWEPQTALKHAQDLVNECNLYIQENQPWKMEDPRVVLQSLHYVLGLATELYAPVFPDKAEAVRKALETNKKAIIFDRLDLK
jgi:methionyl-tRNA synthetase